jgi:uncharacterized protein YoxC
MTRIQLENEIQALLRDMPDGTLEHVLKLLQKVSEIKEDQRGKMPLIDRIIAEDKSLLQRLAQ